VLELLDVCPVDLQDGEDRVEVGGFIFLSEVPVDDRFEVWIVRESDQLEE